MFPKVKLNFYVEFKNFDLDRVFHQAMQRLLMVQTVNLSGASRRTAQYMACI